MRTTVIPGTDGGAIMGYGGGTPCDPQAAAINRLAFAMERIAAALERAHPSPIYYGSSGASGGNGGRG